MVKREAISDTSPEHLVVKSCQICSCTFQEEQKYKTYGTYQQTISKFNGQSGFPTMIQSLGKPPNKDVLKAEFTFASECETLRALFKTALKRKPSARRKLTRNTFFERLGYVTMLLRNKLASTEITWKQGQKGMREAYSRFFKMSKHSGSNTAHYRRAHIKNICSRSAVFRNSLISAVLPLTISSTTSQLFRQ